VRRFQAVFLDRDGVLNTHLPGAYVRTLDELGFIPGVAAAVRRLNDAGLPVVVISNQQGVGKGIMSHDDLLTVQRHLEDALEAEAGARIDAWYYCFDLDGQGSERRKPKPGMLYEAAADLDLDLSRAVFIGDSPTDIGAGLAAPVGAAVLVLSGATREYNADTFTPTPHRVFGDLGAAVTWVLEEQS
jgi:D-glycero-D-manno-heptose 1,7-bisphosphate phosphatase